MLCVIAKIDPASRERLLWVQRVAGDFGVPERPLYGHITLAAYIGGAEDAFISSCKGILAGRDKFPVFYDRIEVLPATSIIVASPRKDGPMAAIYREIAQSWEADFNDWTRADTWHPHTTLVHDPTADLNAIAKAMEKKFQPFTAQVERVEFSRVLETGYEIVDFLELN